MQEKNCTNCRHYRAQEQEGMVLEFGDCRKFPPVVIVVEDQPASMFPQVDHNDDCGEWKAAQ